MPTLIKQEVSLPYTIDPATSGYTFFYLNAVHESYDCHEIPGWYSGTVGYHIDDGKIFETGFHELGKKVEGMGHFDDR